MACGHLAVSGAVGSGGAVSQDTPQYEADQLEDVLLPQERQNLFGHSEVFGDLLEQIRGGRLSGGILLHGPRGIGKATLAFALARELLNMTGDEPSERVCEQIAAGVHPNVFVLRRQPRDGKGFYTAIRVEEVRRVRAALQQTRGRAGFRICIVDSIDDCNVNAANALLKTLEEPPAQTIFMLISHQPGRLLPTIRSRCHAHAMRPIADDELAQFLANEAGVDVQDMNTIAMAGGRPRRALEILTMDDTQILGDLRSWLSLPPSASSGIYLRLADKIAGAGETETAMAREVIVDYLAAEAREAAEMGRDSRIRLASLTDLWDKTHDTFANADTYNLDARQALVTVFDSIHQHKLRTLSV